MKTQLSFIIVMSSNYLSKSILTLFGPQIWHEHIYFCFHCLYLSEATIIPYLNGLLSFLTVIPTFTLCLPCFRVSLCNICSFSAQLSSFQSLSRVQLFATPWTAACQASLSITNSQSLLTHVHWVGDAIQPSHPLSSPSPLFNLSQHQDLFKWVSSSNQVAKVLEFQLQSIKTELFQLSYPPAY